MPDRIRNAMVIDDDEVNRIAHKRVIERSGRIGNVVAFDDAEDAIAFLRRRDRPDIDVIFLDIHMPRMSGFEFLKAAAAEFRDLFARTVVVMLTSSIDPADRRQAMACGAVRAFFNKPLSVEQIDEVVRISGGGRS